MDRRSGTSCQLVNQTTSVFLQKFSKKNEL